MRSSAQVLVYLDIEKALADGVVFEQSSNSVILSPGDADGFILKKYFKAVLDAKTGLPFDPEFPNAL
jgi:2'-phosphotransferase